MNNVIVGEFYDLLLKMVVNGGTFIKIFKYFCGKNKSFGNIFKKIFSIIKTNKRSLVCYTIVTVIIIKLKFQIDMKYNRPIKI